MQEIQLDESEREKIKKLRKNYPYEAIGCIIPFILIIILSTALSFSKPIILMVLFFTILIVLVAVIGNKSTQNNTDAAIQDGYKIIVDTKLKEKKIIESSFSQRPKFITYTLSFENAAIPNINVVKKFYDKVQVNDEFKFELTRKGNLFFKINYNDNTIYSQLDLSTQNLYLI